MTKKTKKESFESYTKRYARSIYHFAHKISSKSKIDFDDAHQEMMIACWKSYQSFDASKGSFSTYAKFYMNNRHKTLLNRSNDDSKPKVCSLELLEVADDYNADEVVCSKVALDNIEDTLKSRRSKSVGDLRAYTMFRMMRRGASMSQCARDMNVHVTWLSKIFKEKIRILGTALSASGIVAT